MWHLCSMMSRWLLSNPPTQNRSKTTWTPDLLCHQRFVFSAAPAPAGKSTSQTDRSSLQPPGLRPDSGHRRPFQKMHGGNKDRRTHTHTQASARVSTNLEAIGDGSGVECSAHSFMHWAVGGGGGERGPWGRWRARTSMTIPQPSGQRWGQGSHKPGEPPFSAVSNGSGILSMAPLEFLPPTSPAAV